MEKCIKIYESLENAPEGYYIYDQAPEVFATWYTGPYVNFRDAHVARIIKEKDYSYSISTSCPMVYYHRKEKTNE